MAPGDELAECGFGTSGGKFDVTVAGVADPAGEEQAGSGVAGGSTVANALYPAGYHEMDGRHMVRWRCVWRRDQFFVSSITGVLPFPNKITLVFGDLAISSCAFMNSY